LDFLELLFVRLYLLCCSVDQCTAFSSLRIHSGEFQLSQNLESFGFFINSMVLPLTDLGRTTPPSARVGRARRRPTTARPRRRPTTALPRPHPTTAPRRRAGPGGAASARCPRRARAVTAVPSSPSPTRRRRPPRTRGLASRSTAPRDQRTTSPSLSAGCRKLERLRM
jgi:hypothetical protein